MTWQKSKEVSNRHNESVEEHRNKNYERFSTRDEQLRRAQDERNQFIRREEHRHNAKLATRERILNNISVEQSCKKEIRKLRTMDAISNQERERKKKQEF